MAKINNINISTQDFIDHKNLLQISDDMIRDNIDKSLIEQILNDLINDQKKSETEIDGLSIVAKGDSYEQDPKVCDKHPEAC